MYIIKTKGTAKIPDYIQIRDDNFVLVCHCRADKPMSALSKLEIDISSEKVKEIINKLTYGVLTKIDL
ncbi:MAG: fructose-6-phosphate aldolase [Chlorobi bacterium]|nr:fructose-6-phosphate aldolase [Chlorobiota bacterium]